MCTIAMPGISDQSLITTHCLLKLVIILFIIHKMYMYVHSGTVMKSYVATCIIIICYHVPPSGLPSSLILNSMLS